jgi:hypothetical protein
MGAGAHRLLRRLHDAATLLAPLDVTVTPLNAAQTTALLTSTCNPDRPGSRPGDSRSDDSGRNDDRIVQATPPAINALDQYDENVVGSDGYPYDTEPDDTQTDDSTAIGESYGSDQHAGLDADTRRGHVGDNVPNDEDWGSDEDWGAGQWAVPAAARQQAPAPARLSTGWPAVGSAVPRGSR